ncbi:uncharacterized protein J5F26_009225 isoform 1-T1 [Ciconia maguari]
MSEMLSRQLIASASLKELHMSEIFPWRSSQKQGLSEQPCHEFTQRRFQTKFLSKSLPSLLPLSPLSRAGAGHWILTGKWIRIASFSFAMGERCIFQTLRKAHVAFEKYWDQTFQRSFTKRREGSACRST